MLQTYSLDVLNASLALSLAHDVMFALIGVTLAASLMSSGRRPIHVVVLSVAAVLLAGPCVLRFGVGEPYLGYSYYALYVWGFRPHQHIAMLMFTGAAGVLFLRGERPLRDGTRGWAGIRRAGGDAGADLGHRRDVRGGAGPLPGDSLVARPLPDRAQPPGGGRPAGRAGGGVRRRQRAAGGLAIARQPGRTDGPGRAALSRRSTTAAAAVVGRRAGSR